MSQQIYIAPVQQAPQVPQKANTGTKETESFESVMKKAVSEAAAKADQTEPEGKQQEEKSPAVPAGQPDVLAMSGALSAVNILPLAAAVQPAETAVPVLKQVNINPTADISMVQTAAQTVSATLPAEGTQSPVQSEAGSPSAANFTVQAPQGTQPPKTAKAHDAVPQTAAAASPFAKETAPQLTAPSEEKAGQSVSKEQPAQPVQKQESLLPAVEEKSSSQSETPSVQESLLPKVQKADAGDDKPQVASDSSSFRDLLQTGNVIIKISDAPSGTQKAVVRQVAEQITVNYKSGNPQFEMQLFPKDLGKVTVKLGIEKGALTVEIFAANPKTQSMLLSDSGQIRSLIESTVHQPVQVQQPSQNSQWDQQQGNEGQGRRQQQREQAENHRSEQQEAAAGNDFVSFIQQLRVKSYSV